MQGGSNRMAELDNRRPAKTLLHAGESVHQLSFRHAAISQGDDMVQVALNLWGAQELSGGDFDKLWQLPAPVQKRIPVNFGLGVPSARTLPGSPSLAMAGIRSNRIRINSRSR